MLDTNIVSSILRNRTGEAACRFRETIPGSAGTSILVGAELRFGYLKTGSARMRDLVETFLADVEMAAWEEPCGIIYAKLRADLHRRGALIGPMDMLIAAHALALDAVLVTDNEREFGRVVGLKVENWIR